MTNPLFPVYIVSKGRHDTRLTAKWLLHTKVPFHMVIEPQERPQYESVLPAELLLDLPQSFKDEYDTFSDIGPSDRTGSGPARNFAWEHSIERGFDAHWCMDDNLRDFQYLNRNRRLRAADGGPLRLLENFLLQYENLAMCGPNYKMFAPSKTKKVPLTVNTRVYSCNLIRNNVPLRWRGRYNEDTDLSLRMLKAGYCTLLCNMILQDKVETGQMKGGNREEIYGGGAKRGGSTWDKTRQLHDMHPDVVKIGKRFGRWHHYIDFSRFRHQKLVRDPNFTQDMLFKPNFKTIAVNDRKSVTSQVNIDDHVILQDGMQTREDIV